MNSCLCYWQSCCTNGCPKAPTWPPPSGRAWDCWWAWARCWRGLPQGRLKTWLGAHQNWQRKSGLLPWAEAPPPLLLSHRGDPLGMEHSTVTQDSKQQRQTVTQKMKLQKKANITHWVSCNPQEKSSTFLFSCLPKQPTNVYQKL